MSRIITGKLVCGWRIDYPCIGTNFKYRVTSPDRPGVVVDFNHLSHAERWAMEHEIKWKDRQQEETT